MPADRPPRGPHRRYVHSGTDPLDERRGRLWSLVLRRFRNHVEHPDIDDHREHDDRT